MSGAYELNKAQFDLIFDEDSTYYVSEFLPYILASYQLVYGNIYDSYSQIYDAPYDTQINTYIDGNFTWNQWNSLIPKKIFDFMQDSVINNMLADSSHCTHSIMKALSLNNLHNWIPERPVKMLYCGMDSMVSPQNSITALDTMLALGATDVYAIEIDADGDHQSCFFPAITYALNWFDDLKISCNISFVKSELNKDNLFSLYPNPVEDKLFVNYFNELDIKIYSIGGQLKSSMQIGKDDYIDISNLESGMYVIIARDKKLNKYLSSKFIKNL